MIEVMVGAGYGRTVALRGTAESLVAARPLLPFWWKDSSGEPESVFDLWAPEGAPLILRNLERWVAEHAIGFTFIHAAVVAVDDRALILPGSSHAGKTTLCVELLRRGAIYLSDEYAVLDQAGQVSPYPRPLQLRENDRRRHVKAASFGAGTATTSLGVGMIAMLTYEADRDWNVCDLRPGLGVLEVLAHGLGARSRPQPALEMVASAAQNAVLMKGVRGSAAHAADNLLARSTRK